MTVPAPPLTVSADARAEALALLDLPRVAPAYVSYRAGNTVLVIGAGVAAYEAAMALPETLACTVLEPVGRPAVDRSTTLPVYQGAIEKLDGYLGQFRVLLAGGDQHLDLADLAAGKPYFDLVLDLTDPPQLRYDVPPPGYFAPRGDSDALARALAELPDLVGEFEKPRFFVYDPSICAHGASGLRGCTRCLDVCPTGAITSLGERIEVDPYLCQGAGGCTTACPSGAIRYTVPGTGELGDALRRALAAYRSAGGGTPRLLFYDQEYGTAALADHLLDLPGDLLPVAVEEIGSVGMDIWLAALAYGAGQVALYVPPVTPASIVAELRYQQTVAQALLGSLGLGDQRLVQVDQADRIAALAAPLAVAFEPARFAAQDDKRTLLRLAIDYLYAAAAAPPAVAELPAGAPFGQIVVDQAACTLCMACVSVCPVGALAAGGEEPALNFIEWNCVQCGLCETACPEDAITRQPRLVFDHDARMASRTLNREQPFCCITCGKPFATASVMRRMEEKLKGHPMFQQPAALQRIKMCADCRVRNLFEADSGA